MKSFIPAPVGTIRGPWTCGAGDDLTGGVQYAVRGPDESWAYFIRTRRRVYFPQYDGEAECRKLAEEYSLKILAEQENKTKCHE